MANTAAALWRRVKTEAGWNHYPAAYWDNGRVKPGVAIVGGKEVKHETGYYELRFREGSRVVFENLKGATAVEAENARRKKEARMSVVKEAVGSASNWRRSIPAGSFSQRN